MNKIIKIQEHKGEQVVSARELYNFLEIKDYFTQWITRMFEYGFRANVDYQAVQIFVKASNGVGGTYKTDYALTMDCAKEIAMIQRTPKGKQAREYFIACEKKLKLATQHELPGTFSEALRLAAKQAEELERKEERLKLQQKVITESKPKVEYYDDVLQSESVYTTTQIAKELGMGAPTLNRKLQELKVQYKQGGVWLLYHRYQNKGLTKTRTHVFTDHKGNSRTSMQTVWTEKGRKFIHDSLN